MIIKFPWARKLFVGIWGYNKFSLYCFIFKSGALRPGAEVSIDNLESRLLGRKFNSYGGPSADKFVGGCIFVGHASGFLYVEHQVSSLLLRLLDRTMKVSVWNGNVVQNYLTDNVVSMAEAIIKLIN